MSNNDNFVQRTKGQLAVSFIDNKYDTFFRYLYGHNSTNNTKVQYAIFTMMANQEP